MRLRCHQLGQALLAQQWSCLVAHDTRFMAGQFARYVYRSLEEQRVPVSFCPDPAPFPSIELALGQRRADTALLISARNQPFWYNGMVLVTPPSDHLPLVLDPPARRLTPPRCRSRPRRSTRPIEPGSICVRPTSRHCATRSISSSSGTPRSPCSSTR
ncbi:MAG: hypothetical protein U0Z44_10100 [Kouleothrix sp.]